MNRIVNQVTQLLEIADDEAVADRFASVVEQCIDFATEETYFQTLLSLPQPFHVLYAALIFDSSVRMDGLADTIPKYGNRDFLVALRAGLILLSEAPLLAVIDRGVAYLRSPNSTALRSATPNVTMDAETGDIHHDYFANDKELMGKIGRFLRKNRDETMRAAGELNVAEDDAAS